LNSSDDHCRSESTPVRIPDAAPNRFPSSFNGEVSGKWDLRPRNAAGLFDKAAKQIVKKLTRHHAMPEKSPFLGFLRYVSISEA
jgi:hypothetical protein